MERFEFMMELEQHLSDIPTEERENALQFYNDYFDDAGKDKEWQIIIDLGSPKKVSDMIKADLTADSQTFGQDGIFTENGYSNPHFDEKPFEVMKNKEYNQSSGQRRQKDYYTGNKSAVYDNVPKANTSSGTKTILIILICIIAIPIVIPIIGSIVGGVIGIFGVAIGLLAGLVGATLALLIGGMAMIGAAIPEMFSNPIQSIFLGGGGLILTGVGLTLTALSTWVLGKLVPGLIRAVIKLCKKPLKKWRSGL